MKTTFWKDIPGYEGWYQVSVDGDVKSLPRTVTKIGASYFTVKGRLMALNKSTAGYPQVTLMKGGKERTWRVHRLVMLAHRGASDLFIDHLNGVRDDNRLENLEYVDNRENVIRGIKMKGRKLPIGVRLVKGKYCARIKVNGQQYALGGFDAPEEASLAYQRASKDLDNIEQYATKVNVNPYGVGVYKAYNKYHATIRKNGKRVFVGAFFTPEEAVEAIRKYKEDHPEWATS